MSSSVRGAGGAAVKELVNSSKKKIADLKKAETGKVMVVGGLGNTPPEKVLQGSIYSDEGGVRRTGTMEDITPDLTTQSDLIKEIRAMLVGRAIEANATPEDILKGKKAYVGEKLITGVLEKGVPLSLFGFSKFVVEEVSFSEDYSTSSPISHSLGAEPKAVYIFTNADASTTTTRRYTKEGFANKIFGATYGVDYNNSVQRMTASISKSTNEKVYVDFGYLKAGITYTLITMA